MHASLVSCVSAARAGRGGRGDGAGGRGAGGAGGSRGARCDSNTPHTHLKLALTVVYAREAGVQACSSQRPTITMGYAVRCCRTWIRLVPLPSHLALAARGLTAHTHTHTHLHSPPRARFALPCVWSVVWAGSRERGQRYWCLDEKRRPKAAPPQPSCTERFAATAAAYRASPWGLGQSGSRGRVSCALVWVCVREGVGEWVRVSVCVCVWMMATMRSVDSMFPLSRK